RRAARLERVAQLGNGNLGYLDHAFTKKMCRWGLMRGVYKKGLAGAGLRGGKWFFAGGHCRGLASTTRTLVGAALCRERGAKRPQDLRITAKSPGPRCGPFATQGRSYKSPRSA